MGIFLGLCVLMIFIYSVLKKPKPKNNKIKFPEGRRATSEEFIKAYQDSRKQTKEKPSNKNTIVSKTENANEVVIKNNNYNLKKISEFNIPEEIFELLWFADGKFKNYNYLDNYEYSFENIKIKIAYSGDQEPSLIFSNLKIKSSENILPTDKIGYYPSYSNLTPEQRYIYLKWLENPFENINIDIGYVFLFYYGLERCLFLKKSKKALLVILKLMNSYKNTSFFSYAFECLIFFCICSKDYSSLKRILLGTELINSPLALYGKFLSKIPLYSKDLIDLSSSVEFKNKRYIKMYPELFNEFLEKNMNLLLGKNYINLGEYHKNLGKTFIFGVANYSLRKSQPIDIPNILSNSELKKLIFDLLSKTHEDVKVELKKIRKNK